MSDRTRGYWGFAAYKPKKEVNIGTLWRSAQILGASALFTIGRRYLGAASDTTKAWRHIPLFNTASFEEFRELLPLECQLVGVELVDRAPTLRRFRHPQRAIYLLGAEDEGLPDSILSTCHSVVRLEGRLCYNVAVAGSIVAYHREHMA